MLLCHQYLFRSLINGPFARESRQSRLSAYDKGDIEMKPGAVLILELIKTLENVS